MEAPVVLTEIPVRTGESMSGSGGEKVRWYKFTQNFTPPETSGDAPPGLSRTIPEQDSLLVIWCPA